MDYHEDKAGGKRTENYTCHEGASLKNTFQECEGKGERSGGKGSHVCPSLTNEPCVNLYESGCVRTHRASAAQAGRPVVAEY